MKKLVMCILMCLFLIGCVHTTTISQVENKWGPPAQIEQRGDATVYYYHFYKEEGGALVYRGIVIATARGGWYTVEITTDKDGKIMGKRQYWKQP
jgi:hypothetical protein